MPSPRFSDNTSPFDVTPSNSPTSEPPASSSFPSKSASEQQEDVDDCDPDEFPPLRRGSSMASQTTDPKVEQELYISRTKWLLAPASENPALRKWESLNALALLFVCFVTPFEVAFLDAEFGVLFCVNRFFDCIFIVDMVLQFFTMQEVKHRYGVLFIFNQRVIAKRYLESWFIVDFLSVGCLTFDILGLMWADGGDVSRLRLLRSIRLLRLLKLARLFRGMRALRRWEETSSFSYRKMTLVQMALRVVVSTHWISCVIGLSVTLLDNPCIVEGYPQGCTSTWVVDADITDRETAIGFYLTSVHVALSILIHPHTWVPRNTVERLSFILFMILGGCIWTRVISQSTAIRASLDRASIGQNQTLDDLNAMASDLQLSPALRKRLRAFFLEKNENQRTETWAGIVSQLSPALQREVSENMNRTSLRNLRILKGCSDALLTDLMQCLNQSTYSQGETFGEVFTVYILYKGLVARFVNNCLINMRSGDVWGEEHLMLTAWWLLSPNTGAALTFVQVLHVSRERFLEITERHPGDRKALRRSFCILMLRHGLRYEVKKRKALEKGEMISPGFAEGTGTSVAARARWQIHREIDRGIGVVGYEAATAAKDETDGIWQLVEQRLGDQFDALHGRLEENLVEQSKGVERRLDAYHQQLDRQLEERHQRLEQSLIALGKLPPVDLGAGTSLPSSARPLDSAAFLPRPVESGNSFHQHGSLPAPPASLRELDTCGALSCSRICHSEDACGGVPRGTIYRGRTPYVPPVL